MEIRLATFSPVHYFLEERVSKDYLLLCAESDKENIEKMLPPAPFTPDDLRKAVASWEIIPSFFVLCEKDKEWFACATNDWSFHVLQDNDMKTLPIDGTSFVPNQGRYIIAPAIMMDRCTEDDVKNSLKNPYDEELGFNKQLTCNERAWILQSSSFPVVENEIEKAFDPEQQRLRRRSKATSIGMAIATIGMLTSIGYHFYDNQPKAIDDPYQIIRLENSRFLGLQKKYEEQLVQALKEASSSQTQQILKLHHENKSLADKIQNLELALELRTVEAANLAVKGQSQSSMIDEINKQLTDRNDQLKAIQNQFSDLEVSHQKNTESKSQTLAMNEELQQKNLRMQEQIIEQTKAIETLLLTANEAKVKADRTIDENIRCTKLNHELTQELAKLQDSHSNILKREQESELAHTSYLNELKRQVHEQQKALTALQDSRASLNNELKQIRAEQSQIKSNPLAAKASASTVKLPDQKNHSHIVKPGETLSTISEKYYGTSKRWKEIWEANSKQISNPYQIKVGSTLVIP
ncbi:MAG: LysM peptidoglycan-binding domain-containing protein [Parachlamydiales bacterium]|nr:LysM peptidoglycan-binding domain-containing protein [Parachlamydiales bacterium]